MVQKQLEILEEEYLLFQYSFYEIGLSRDVLVETKKREESNLFTITSSP